MSRRRWAWQRARCRVLERDGHHWVVCGATGIRFDVDHIVPLANGGSNALTNLRTLCVDCHRRRGHTQEAPLYEAPVIAIPLQVGDRQGMMRRVWVSRSSPSMSVEVPLVAIEHELLHVPRGRH